MKHYVVQQNETLVHDLLTFFIGIMFYEVGPQLPNFMSCFSYKIVKIFIDFFSKRSISGLR